MIFEQRFKRILKRVEEITENKSLKENKCQETETNLIELLTLLKKIIN